MSKTYLNISELNFNKMTDIKACLRFFQSVAKRNLYLTKYFIQNGVDTNFAMDDGCTALMLMCTNIDLPDIADDIRLEFIYQLLNNNARLDVQDKHGRTCLMYACAEGLSVCIIRYLLNNGADIFQTDLDSFTAFDYAEMNGHRKILKCLNRHRKQIMNDRLKMQQQTFKPSKKFSWTKHKQDVDQTWQHSMAFQLDFFKRPKKKVKSCQASQEASMPNLTQLGQMKKESPCERLFEKRLSLITEEITACNDSTNAKYKNSTQKKINCGKNVIESSGICIGEYEVHSEMLGSQKEQCNSTECPKQLNEEIQRNHENVSTELTQQKSENTSEEEQSRFEKKDGSVNEENPDDLVFYPTSKGHGLKLEGAKTCNKLSSNSDESQNDLHLPKLSSSSDLLKTPQLFTCSNNTDRFQKRKLYRRSTSEIDVKMFTTGNDIGQLQISVIPQIKVTRCYDSHGKLRRTRSSEDKTNIIPDGEQSDAVLENIYNERKKRSEKYVKLPPI